MFRIVSGILVAWNLAHSEAGAAWSFWLLSAFLFEWHLGFVLVVPWVPFFLDFRLKSSTAESVLRGVKREGRGSLP